MEDIASFTLEDLKAYYSAYYNPVNAFLVVVGDFKKEDLLPKIEKAFGSISKGIAPNQDRNKEPMPARRAKNFCEERGSTPLHGNGLSCAEPSGTDSYVLEVITTILSGGKSSRLYQGLVREKRLVLSADADQSLLSRDPSLFYLSADLLPGKELGDVEKALEQEIERLKKNPLRSRSWKR